MANANKQAKRKALLEAAEWFDDGYEHSPDNQTAWELRRMAEEIKND